MPAAVPHVRAAVRPPMLTLVGATLYAVQGAVYLLDAATGTVHGHFADTILAPVAVGGAVGGALYAISSTRPTSALLALDSEGRWPF